MKFYNMTEEEITAFKMKTFWKITNEKENHNKLQYQDGLVRDSEPFNPNGDCESGGIYFSAEDILSYLNYGPWIREVTFPEDTKIYLNPGMPVKWKADQVILGPRRKWGCMSVIKKLVDQGADIHTDNDYALRWAAASGLLEVVAFLVEARADVHVRNDRALRWAAANGHLDVVKFLVEAGADIHDDDARALQWAAANGHLEVVKYLESLP